MDFDAYRQTLLDIARRHYRPERYLSPPSSQQVGSALPVTLSCDHLRLSVWLAAEGSQIVAARFEAEGQDTALLAAFCEVVEGLPLEEAAAYGVDYVLLQFAREAPNPTDVGIIPAAALLPILATAQELLRALRHQRRMEVGTSPIGRARFLAIPESWQRLNASERLSHLRVAIAAYLRQHGLPDNLIVADRLEEDSHHRPTRLIVTHIRADEVIPLPPLMRALERHLRNTIAPWVELYTEERTDRNALRRTILTDLRKS